MKKMLKHWNHLKMFRIQKNALERDQRLNEVVLRKQEIEQQAIRKNKEYLIRWELRREEQERQKQAVIELVNNK